MKSFIVTRGEKALALTRIPEDIKLTKEQEELLRQSLDYDFIQLVVVSPYLGKHLVEKYKMENGKFIFDDAEGYCRVLWRRNVKGEDEMVFIMEVYEDMSFVETAFFKHLTKYKDNSVWYSGLINLFNYNSGGNMNELTFVLAKSLMDE